MAELAQLGTPNAVAPLVEAMKLHWWPGIQAMCQPRFALYSNMDEQTFNDQLFPIALRVLSMRSNWNVVHVLVAMYKEAALAPQVRKQVTTELDIQMLSSLEQMMEQDDTEIIRQLPSLACEFAVSGSGTYAGDVSRGLLIIDCKWSSLSMAVATHQKSLETERCNARIEVKAGVCAHKSDSFVDACAHFQSARLRCFRHCTWADPDFISALYNTASELLTVYEGSGCLWDILEAERWINMCKEACDRRQNTEDIALELRGKYEDKLQLIRAVICNNGLMSEYKSAPWLK